MPELQPGGFYSGYMTMANSMGQNQDRAARLQQFLQDAPLETQRKQAELQAQQFQNQNATTMMQAKLQGSPWEIQKHADELALKKQELEKQYALLNNTIRHQGLVEQNQAEAARRMATQPIWDPDSSTWQYPPGGSRLAPQGGQQEGQQGGATLTGEGAWPGQSGMGMRGNPDVLKQQVMSYPGLSQEDRTGILDQIGRQQASVGGMTEAPTGSSGGTDVPIMSHKKAELARQLRSEMITQIKPLTELESDIAQARKLVAGGPLAHQMLNEKLISILDSNRTSSKLFEGNRNFGDLTERIVGKVGRFFTGKYTEEQQKEIDDTLKEMQANVISPAKERIGSYYKGMARQDRVPESQLDVPDFYGTKEQSNGGWSVKRIK